jgi:hypothetical protein
MSGAWLIRPYLGTGRRFVGGVFRFHDAVDDRGMCGWGQSSVEVVAD